MRVSRLFVIGALMLALLPASASAQGWTFTPFIGSNFGGNADFGEFATFDDEFEKRVDFGGTLGWLSDAGIGLEVDFGYSPNFFEDTGGDSNFDFGDSNVTTLMGNLVLGVPGGQGVRPYGSGGFGLIRSHVEANTFFRELNTNDWGVNVGGGLIGYFNDNVGLRGDLRYFRSLQDNEPGDALDLALSDFDFWRGSAGLTFRW